jgi:1-deoxyxylulose-5-phosphate synthase
MKMRELGDSGIMVSEISLGSWLTYGVGVSADKARACLDQAFDEGINFIDTSNVYGKGAAETFLGDALSGRPRDSYVMATKLFFPMTETDKGLSRPQIMKQIDASLARLQTDYVDLYQCHRYDDDTPIAETIEALSDVVRSGKARAIGFSEWSPANIRNIRCSGGGPKTKSFRCAPQTAFRKSSGRRSRKGYSRANIASTRRRLRTAALPMKAWDR